MDEWSIHITLLELRIYLTVCQQGVVMEGLDVVEFLSLTTEAAVNLNFSLEDWNLTSTTASSNRTLHYINVTSELPIEYAQPMYG